MVKIDLDDLIESAEDYDMEIVITVSSHYVTVGSKKWVRGNLYGDYITIPACEIKNGEINIDEKIDDFLYEQNEILRTRGR